MRGIFFRFLYYTGLGHLLMFYHKIYFRIPILVFHRISPHSDKFWHPLTPQQFEKHIKFLSKKYSFLSLNDLFNKSNKKLNNGCIIVFDDAFKDFYEYALPVIKKYQIPVTMFVPVECINKNKIIWTSILDNSIKYTGKKELRLNINGSELHFSLANESEKIKSAFKIQKLLIELPDSERKSKFEYCIENLGHKDDSNIKTMCWEEILQTVSSITYQSHSMTHPVLSRINDESILNYEIYNSKNMLASKTGRTVDFISYPVGMYNDKVIDISKKYYKAGFAVNNKLVHIKKLNDETYKYSIPRFNVHYSSPFELFFRINGFHKLFGK